MFSVVIPTYKRDEDLRNCLQSLKENTVGPYEVIVLHPGTESTIDLCRQFGAREICDNARKNGKRIKSLWAIINDGIRASAYDYAMYLNDDCLVLSQWDLIAKQYFEDPQLGLLVLKTKGIGLDPAFRTIPTLFDYPCANYAIINKKAEILFDEHYDWFWGDADIPLQFAAMSKYKIMTTAENMVIHNHRIDDTRVNNESSEKNRADENYFQTKWKDYKRKGQYLRKKSKFDIYTEIVVFKIKRRIKLYISILSKNLNWIKEAFISIFDRRLRYSVQGYSSGDDRYAIDYYYKNFLPIPQENLRLSAYNPHIRFYESHGEEKIRKQIHVKKNKLTVFITHECVHSQVVPNAAYYRDNCLLYSDISLGFDYLDAKNYVRFPYWLFRFFPVTKNKDIIAAKVKEFNSISYKKNKFCALIASHDMTGIRAKMLRSVNKIETVMLAGKFMQNDKTLITDFNNNKYEYLKQFKFNLCPENDVYKGYVTEKIFDALEADCIPIYWGGDVPPEPDVINSKAVILLDPDEPENALHTIQTLYINEKAYANFKKNKKLNDYAVDWIADIMQHTFDLYEEKIKIKSFYKTCSL